MTPSPLTRSTHLVPTHVRTPETLLTIGGIGLSVRQFLLILVGLALGYQSWLLLGFLAHLPAGQVLRVLLALIPAGITLACAFLAPAGRPLDVWCVIVLRFVLRPPRCVWRSVRFVDPGLGGLRAEEEAADGTTR